MIQKDTADPVQVQPNWSELAVLFKVHIFWEGNNILWNFHLTYVLCSASQIKVEISQNFGAFTEYVNFKTASFTEFMKLSFLPKYDFMN